MKTPRELILERHQAAEAKLKAIRADDLAVCARLAAQPSPQRRRAFNLSTAARFWQETFWPWRRAWTGMAAIWVFILAFTLAFRETPRAASARPPRPDPEVLAVLQEQKELLTQLLGPGVPPLISHLRAPSPRSEADPPPAGAGRIRATGAQAWRAAAQANAAPLTPSLSPTEGERMPFRAGEGDSEGMPGIRGSRCLRLETTPRARTLAQA